VTNATGEAILSSDGGATWRAGWTSWATNGATMTVLLHESVRQTTVLTGGSFTATPAAGTYVFTTGTASADVKAVPMQEGRQRWNADFTGYEYLLSMTNLSGEALLTKNAGSTWETALSDWVTEGGEWRVGVRSATGRIAGWGDLPPDTSFDEGQWNVTFSNVSTGFTVRVETFTVTHVWSGAAGTDDFATAGNWKAADGSAATSAPGADSTVYIPAGATAAATNAVTVSSAFSVKALHVGAARLEPGGAKLTFKHREENAVEGNVHFYTRAFVTHTYLPSSSTRIDQEVYRAALAAGGDFSLEKGAAIDVTSCGYAGSKGPGFKLNTASHGGRLGTSYGECYGSLACPTNHGSGADRDRRGGGSVRVAAGGELFVNGTVAADGQWLSGEYNSGAGGSVWLSGATLTGAGVLRADGGRTSYGSSGSGGRVAVHLSQAADFSAWRGTFSAHGGSCVSTGQASTGAPGTIYLQAAGRTRATATVIVDNADLSHQGKGQPTGFAEFSDVTESDAFGTLIVRNNGSVRFLPGATYTFAGSLLTHDDTAKYSGRVIAYPDVTLVFTGATETVITGTNALPRLRCTEPGKTIRFGSSASDAFLILGGALFEFRGSAERPITLTGVNDDLWWVAYGPQVRQDVRYAVVNASDASGGLAGMAYASAAGTAGNVNWHLADLPAPGASVTWNGSVSGDWNDARNWTPARVPMETDAVTVPGSAPDMPTVASNDVTVATLTVEAGASLSLVALNLTVTGNVRVAGALAAFYRESLIAGGNVDFSGATVTPAEMTLLLTGDAAQTVNLAGTEIHDFVVRKSGGSLTVVGDFTCADLDLRETGALTCLFGAGNTVTCADLRVTGVTLGSTVSGTRWKIDVRSSATVLGIQVSDSEATGLAVFADSSSRETPGHSDSNVRWYFGSLAQTWTGAAGDGKWETAGNWSPADVPGPTSRVVIASATTVTAACAAVVQNLVVGDGTAAAKVVLEGTLSAEDGVEVMNGATLTANKPMSVKGNMSVREGGTLTHTELPAKSSKITDGVYAVDVTCGGSFNLEAGGTVNVVGKGYPTGYGPGYANRQGAHGGSFYEDKTYGSAICPTNHGSASCYKPGGGVVRITADGDVCVNGTITAEGDYRTGEYDGAAGGSVWLTGARLTGSGTVSVNGGFATYGYSGGGGRLAVHLTEATDFSDWHGDLTARGGKSGSTKNGPHGPAGTIYLQTAGGTRTNATLIVDNEELTPVSSGWADLDASSGTDAIGTVIVANNARVCVKANEAIDVYGDWFARGGWMRVKDGALVRFAGPGDHLVTGSNEFCDVTCEAPGATMRFGTLAEDCFTIGTGHRLTWKGTDGYPLSLLPFPEDTGAWRMWLKTDCSTAIEYVSASNSDARAGLSVLAIESHDLGGNRNWGFSARIYPGDPIYWTGAGGNALWTDTANWEDQAGGHRAPIESDRVVIPKPGASPSFWPVLEDGTTVQNKIEVNAGGELTLRNVTLYVTNALTVAGTLKAPGGEATVTVICSNAVDFAGGTFEEGLSVFRLEGAQSQSVNPGGCSFHRFEIQKDGGSVTFGAGFTAANLDVLTTDPVSLAFAAGETVTAAEAYVRGRRTDTTGSTWPLVLKSAVADSAWYLNTTAVHYFSGVDVSDSTATGARVVADALSRNGGNNVNWLFADKASEWTGAAGDGKWETAGNWYPEGVPDASTRAYLTGRAGKAVTVTVSQETTVSNLTLGAGLGTVAVKAYAPMTIRGDLEVRMNGTFSVNNTRTNSVVTGNVAVRAGGTITHEPLPNTIGTVAEAETKGYRLRLSVGGDVTVDAGGAINVTGKGYPTGYGPGYANRQGAHGGTLYEGKVYGSASCPTNHGSASSYKPGGGAVRLEVTGTLTVNGTIVSEGDYRTGEYDGAAGGSVWLSCARILGAGTVSANGGFATYGYSGGGGRLALYLTQAKDLSAWHGTLTARGGKSGSTSHGPHGPAGTVYVRTAGGAFADGAVIVDNGGLSPISSGWTELYPEAELAGIGAIAVTNYATARIGTDTPRRTFRRASLDVGAASRTDVRTDVYLRDLVLSSPTATLNLATNTVTVLSATHRDGRRWAAGATVTSQTNDVTGVCGKIVWKVQSTVLIVR